MAQFKRRVKQLKDQAKSMGRQKSKRMVLRKRPKLTKKKPKPKKNELHTRLRMAAEKARKIDELEAILAKHGLNQNRKQERIVHGVFKGNDVKKFGYFLQNNQGFQIF